MDYVVYSHLVINVLGDLGSHENNESSGLRIGSMGGSVWSFTGTWLIPGTSYLTTEMTDESPFERIVGMIRKGETRFGLQCRSMQPGSYIGSHSWGMMSSLLCIHGQNPRMVSVVRKGLSDWYFFFVGVGALRIRLLCPHWVGLDVKSNICTRSYTMPTAHYSPLCTSGHLYSETFQAVSRANAKCSSMQSVALMAVKVPLFQQLWI
jgi:hypothetical protein